MLCCVAGSTSHLWPAAPACGPLVSWGVVPAGKLSSSDFSPHGRTGSFKPVSYGQWVSIFFAHNTFFRDVFKGSFTLCHQEPLLSAGKAPCCPGLFSVQQELRHAQLSPHYVASLFVASVFLDQIRLSENGVRTSLPHHLACVVPQLLLAAHSAPLPEQLGGRGALGPAPAGKNHLSSTCGNVTKWLKILM